jgi:hypothetical protein
MSTGMLGLQNCPRSVAELKGLPRGVRFRLAMQLNMFADEHQELAFNGATDDQQCEALAAGLASWDQHNGVAGGSPEQQMQMPAPQPPQQMQMQLPPQPSMQQQVQVPQQQPQFAPPQFAPPQQPAIQPPVQPPAQPQFAPPQGMQPSMGAPPQQQPPRNPQPSTGMPPAIQPPAMAPPPQAPPQQPPPQPQMAPPPVEMPARQPATSADPGNQGGAALPILRGMADTLKALAAANGTNQKWLEQLHEQSLGHAKMFEILLTMLLVFCEQQGLDQKTMAGLCKQVTDENRGAFLGKLDPQGKE